jgi:hypothetical protein
MQKSTTFTTIFRVKKCHFRYDMQKKKHFGNLKIIKDNTRLMEYTGSRVKILGYITVPALYKNNSCIIKMFVSKSNGR